MPASEKALTLLIPLFFTKLNKSSSFDLTLSLLNLELSLSGINPLPIEPSNSFLSFRFKAYLAFSY